MAGPHSRTMTASGFLFWESRQVDPHEFLNGEVLDTFQESPIHSAIAANIAITLANRLRGTPCRVMRYGTQLLAADSSVLLPDVMMICARTPVGDEHVTEPMVVFEVLSDATERRDRILKNRVYRGVPSLRQYVMVFQDRLCVESVFRTEHGWYHEMTAGAYGVLALPAHGLDLPLAQIYAETPILERAIRPLPVSDSIPA